MLKADQAECIESSELFVSAHGHSRETGGSQDRHALTRLPDLAIRSSPSADSQQIAAAAADTWHAIEAAISPIIGERAVAALFTRSLHLRRRDFPWLAAACADMADYSSFAVFREAISQQSIAVATAAHDALIETFGRLLGNLIGESLTQRLLACRCEHRAEISELDSCRQTKASRNDLQT